MLWSREWVQHLEPGAASSEAEFHQRGCQALERGGVPPEGASGPRARRSSARGGVRLSSETGFHPRGRQALERGSVYTAWRPVLERGGNSLEGYHGRSVGGPLWLLLAVGLSTFGL
jgi:hypothetical protein